MESKKKFKYSKKIISNSIVYKISMTINLAFFLFCIILLLLYFIGNYQDFQDSSQSIILSILFYSSIFNSFFSFLLLIESVLKIFSENKKIRHIINSFFLIIVIIFGIFCMSISNIIMFFSEGFGL